MYAFVVSYDKELTKVITTMTGLAAFHHIFSEYFPGSVKGVILLEQDFVPEDSGTADGDCGRMLPMNTMKIHTHL